MTQTSLRFEDTIQDRFEAFHRAHPEVYAYLVSLCQDLRARGRRRCGIRLLWERVRWYFQIERGQDEFKCNDHFHSRYARKIVAEYPEFQDFFEFRNLRAE